MFSFEQNKEIVNTRFKTQPVPGVLLSFFLYFFLSPFSLLSFSLWEI